MWRHMKTPKQHEVDSMMGEGREGGREGRLYLVISKSMCRHFFDDMTPLYLLYFYLKTHGMLLRGSTIGSGRDWLLVGEYFNPQNTFEIVTYRVLKVWSLNAKFANSMIKSNSNLSMWLQPRWQLRLLKSHGLPKVHYLFEVILFNITWPNGN